MWMDFHIDNKIEKDVLEVLSKVKDMDSMEVLNIAIEQYKGSYDGERVKLKLTPETKQKLKNCKNRSQLIRNAIVDLAINEGVLKLWV